MRSIKSWSIGSVMWSSHRIILPVSSLTKTVFLCKVCTLYFRSRYRISACDINRGWYSIAVIFELLERVIFASFAAFCKVRLFGRWYSIIPLGKTGRRTGCVEDGSEAADCDLTGCVFGSFAADRGEEESGFAPIPANAFNAGIWERVMGPAR